MKETNNFRDILLITGLILISVISRVVNVELHLVGNFACVGAISLFSGNILSKKPSLAYLIPLAAYLLSDLYIQFFTDRPGFYGLSQYFVYAAMIMVVFLGTRMGRPKALKVLGFSIAGSMIFWIVSNFGVWFANEMLAAGNPVREEGLTLGFTYLRALPFYNDFSSKLFFGTFIGDLFFSGVLFGAYALLKNRATAPEAVAG